MRRPNWLDAMLERFQHSWETNAQFRAMWSGAAGLVMIVGLCAMMAFAATFAGAVGNTLGGGGAGNFITSSGPNPQATDVVFPMTTLTPWPDPNIPAAQNIPASKTPQPTATPAPTATPLPTATPCFGAGCGGGGGGGGGGGSDKITVSINPATFTYGTAITAYIHTSTPYEGYAISITWPDGAFMPQSIQGQVDGSGNATASIGKVPSGGGCPGGTLKLWVVTQNNVTGVTGVFTCS